MSTKAVVDTRDKLGIARDTVLVTVSWDKSLKKEPINSTLEVGVFEVKLSSIKGELIKKTILLGKGKPGAVTEDTKAGVFKKTFKVMLGQMITQTPKSTTLQVIPSRTLEARAETTDSPLSGFTKFTLEPDRGASVRVTLE